MNDIIHIAGPLWPYTLVILVGFLPSELWRVLGVFLSRGIDERSEFLIWTRAVSVALLAGVVAKLLLAPAGALATIPLLGRFGALLAGLGGYFLLARSAVAGVLLGEIVLISVSWLFSS